jgi:hypothetical protein
MFNLQSSDQQNPRSQASVLGLRQQTGFHQIDFTYQLPVDIIVDAMRAAQAI